MKGTLVGNLLWRFNMSFNRSSMNAAKKAVKDTGKEAETAGKKFKKLNRILQGVGISFSVLAAMAAARGVINSIREYERLGVILETVTGSAEAAAAAQGFIDRMARRLPFTIDQVAEAFIRLKGAGLEPTEQQMMAFGNVAATMGSDIDSLIGAAQSAARGMPRALEGILRTDIATKGSHIEVLIEGERVRVERDMEAVLNFLQEMGEDRYAGGAERMMNSLNGAFSNFGDTMRQFSRRIGEGGFGPGMRRLVNALGSLTSSFSWLGNIIGFLLGTPMSLLAAVIQVLSDNLILFSGVLIPLAMTVLPALASSVFPAITAGLGGINAMLTLATLKIAAIMAVGALLAIAIEDIYFFVEGRPSLLGRLIPEEDQDSWRAVFGAIGAAITTLLDPTAYMRLGETIGEWVHNFVSVTIPNATRAAVGHVMGALTGLVRWVQDLGVAFINWLIGYWNEIMPSHLHIAPVGRSNWGSIDQRNEMWGEGGEGLGGSRTADVMAATIATNLASLGRDPLSMITRGQSPATEAARYRLMVEDELQRMQSGTGRGLSETTGAEYRRALSLTNERISAGINYTVRYDIDMEGASVDAVREMMEENNARILTFAEEVNSGTFDGARIEGTGATSP